MSEQIILCENIDYMKVVKDPNDPTGIATMIATHCPLPIWMYPDTNCGLTTAQLADKYVPSGVKYEIIDADKYDEWVSVGIGSTALLLADSVTSYNFDTKQSEYDITIAKKIAHRKRRNRRYSEFAPHDSIISKGIPGTTESAETSRAAIRTKYSTMQTEIDSASTVDELYVILEKYPSLPKPKEAILSEYQKMLD